ncbi:hypothetical protein U8335_11905 [Roseiconus lacunae]|uniref:hypothetical protein n=1 Tax=Roseiconus lacunae TaxID=2605694 RepID=UPI0030852FAE|nr:hypothetical protein U8335_11905 [Stieleria sp. HD01]
MPNTLMKLPTYSRTFRIDADHLIACLAFCSFLVSSSGCTLVSKRLPDKNETASPQASIGDRAEAASSAMRVSNPPAQQIRFDGQEQLLGGGSCQAMPPKDLANQLTELIEQKKLRSAATLVQLHQRSACRLLLGQPAHVQPDVSAAVLTLISDVIDDGNGKTNWRSLVDRFQTDTTRASQWHTTLASLGASGEVSSTSQDQIHRLKLLSSELESPLLQIESLRLEGQFRIASGKTSLALESLVSAAELAAQHGLSNLASDLWLMSCEASLRLDQIEQSRQCWNAAVSSGLASMHTRGANQGLPTIDTVFWEQAVRLAHPGDKLPKELTVTLAPWHSRLGIRMDGSLTPEVALWSAIAEYQLATGQPHLASLSIKRAETIDATSTQVRSFLQIALARSMAAQGQQAVATTILGTLTESDNPRIRASSLATLGSIKIQSGAYEQGSKFLGQALSIRGVEDWPGRLAAEADLANARLIMGDLDNALQNLHAVQAQMLKDNRWQSLCQSLANEAAILHLEGRKEEAELIRQRIDSIESRTL